MMSAQPKHQYTLEEYLDMDRQSEERLEYWDGEIFDMSGASEEHGEIEAILGGDSKKGDVEFFWRIRGSKFQACRLTGMATRLHLASKRSLRKSGA